MFLYGSEGMHVAGIFLGVFFVEALLLVRVASLSFPLVVLRVCSVTYQERVLLRRGPGHL